MTELRPMQHLSDEEIDAYWKGTLSPADEERVEQHYIECTECASRVRLIEDLVTNLRDSGTTDTRALHVRAWQIAAMLFAAFSVLAGWQWARHARDTQVQHVEVAPVDAPLVAVRLAPPTRDERIPEVRPVPTAVAIFLLDAREAGAGGTRFDLSLTTATGRTVLQLPGLASAPDGTVRVPVDGSLLVPGQYAFELHAGPMVVGFPFLIQR